MSEYKLMLDEEEVEIFKEILTLCSNEFKRDMIRKRIPLIGEMLLLKGLCSLKMKSWSFGDYAKHDNNEKEQKKR